MGGSTSSGGSGWGEGGLVGGGGCLVGGRGAVDISVQRPYTALPHGASPKRDFAQICDMKFLKLVEV